MKSLEAADKLINGELVVLDTIESQPYSLESIDWNASFSDAYQKHLQSLNFIAYLTKAYELTKEKKYLDLGKGFLEEWDNYRAGDAAEGNILVWDGYVSAMRASNIVYFVLSAEKGDENYFSQEERQWISEIVEEHARLFAQQKGDINNSEAGIYQDQALLYCAYFLNNENNRDELVMKLLKTTFRPELINRIDEIITFNSISESIAYEILERLINDLNKRLNYMLINITLTKEAKEKIITESFDKEFGARPVKRYITKHIENLISKYILDQEVMDNVELKIDVDNNEFVIKNV